MTQSKVSIARGHVAALRAALLCPSPDEIARCAGGLVEAAQCLVFVKGLLETGLVEEGLPGEDLGPELDALKNELRSVDKLIEHGAAFNRGWARLLGAATAGYTPSGEAASLSVPGAISVQG